MRGRQRKFEARLLRCEILLLRLCVDLPQLFLERLSELVIDPLHGREHATVYGLARLVSCARDLLFIGLGFLGEALSRGAK